MKQKLQETHQSMRDFLDVDQETQKIYSDRSRYGPSYKTEEVLVFNPMLKMKTKNYFFL